MHSRQVRTVAIFTLGVLLFLQFLLNQVETPLQPSGLILLVAAAIFLGMGVMRIRDPTPTDSPVAAGFIDYVFVVIVVVLTAITVGLAILVLF